MRARKTPFRRSRSNEAKDCGDHNSFTHDRVLRAGNETLCFKMRLDRTGRLGSFGYCDDFWLEKNRRKYQFKFTNLRTVFKTIELIALYHHEIVYVI